MHKVKILARSYGAFSVFGNDDSSKENPNVGKDLTDEETFWAVAVQRFGRWDR